ncbi:hypothetical protein AYI69_g6011 [Smittium culicis]|uniref:Uncharacterized protein n=1 Tax=Smittium culicis TaxID=133412 RepID=A0A1R1Y2L0_9FUNG|nr:hypothetical protein AYI69_g6011 [Smittium culicis]
MKRSNQAEFDIKVINIANEIKGKFNGEKTNIQDLSRKLEKYTVEQNFKEILELMRPVYKKFYEAKNGFIDGDYIEVIGGNKLNNYGDPGDYNDSDDYNDSEDGEDSDENLIIAHNLVSHFDNSIKKLHDIIFSYYTDELFKLTINQSNQLLSKLLFFIDTLTLYQVV